MHPALRTRGTTLVEMVITIMVVSIAIAGVLTVININARTSADPMTEHQAITIAEAYLEEVLTREFHDPDGTAVSEGRSTYDNVADYNGLLDTGAKDQNGNAITGLEEYTVEVQVTSEALSGIPDTISATYVLRVQVTVTPPRGGQPVTLSGYRTDY